MTIQGVVGAVLTPHILGAMILAGAAYGLTFLWALNVRDQVRLYLVALVPGLVFLSLMLALRAAGGVLSPVYPVLLVDWMVFAHAGFAAVLARRWLIQRRRR